NVAKAKRSFGFKAEIGLEEGLKETVDWYMSNKKVAV
ncbi:MAG TPA: NAD-dependent epimerase, partial [Balneola sp.]|nr:NAD-dependent epimerase [Balneola sp.]